MGPLKLPEPSLGECQPLADSSWGPLAYQVHLGWLEDSAPPRCPIFSPLPPGLTGVVRLGGLASYSGIAPGGRLGFREQWGWGEWFICVCACVCVWRGWGSL